jgi:tRNA C32,U32 (ribose-2'-O)-methylase TrmJ
MVLIRAGFLDRANPARMMRDVRRIFNSARLDDRDVTVVRGIFRKMDTMIRLADEKIRRLEESGGNDPEGSRPLQAEDDPSGI